MHDKHELENARTGIFEDQFLTRDFRKILLPLYNDKGCRLPAMLEIIYI